jgi:adenylate cyclase
MYRLIYQDGDTPQAYTFTEGEVTIGRSPDCQIVLKDFGISRTHAKLVADEDGVRIQDLKSKNGTQVNGVPVVEAPLKDGDRILLGKFQLSFSKTLEGKVVLDEAKPLSEEAGTIIRSVGELSKLLSDTGQQAAGLAEKKAAPDVQDVEKANRILKVLTKVAETLIAVRPVEEVLHQVMDIVFEHVPADRGFLMLSEDGSDKLIPMVVKHRNSSSATEGKISISKTIADRVTKDRVSILTSDALVDPRFGAGDSIRFHGIRSAMCAPLWNKEQVIGIIHVDSPMLTNCFTLNDLDLLTALANYAAVAVERARLNQKIIAEEKKRERLGRFLSPQVTARIIAATSESQGMALGVPEVKEVSVLFSDIVGFTTMSEKMSPAAVSLLLNDYFSRMTDIIFKYEGTLDKYIGDAIMAVWGAPLDMADHAVRAIKAALEMREQLEVFNTERKEPTLRIRIGINSGKAVAGEIGGINKKEYTVLGDTVNTASRLESSVAKPMTIVIGENTYNAVREQFECKSLGPATLKGKERTVEVYEVLGPVGMAAGVSPPRPAASGEV